MAEVVDYAPKVMLGEGLFWDDRNQKIRYLDISGKLLIDIDPVKKTIHSVSTPHRPGAYALIDPNELSPLGSSLEVSKGKFLVGYEDGFHITDSEVEKRENIYKTAVIDSSHDGRLNDGRCDRQGRFVCGGYNAKETDGTWNKYQTVWQVTKGDVKPLFETKCGCSNACCWSPDGKTMYWSDSGDKKLLKFDYDIEKGETSNETVFVDFAARGYEGIADGATVDTEGGIWVANFGGGRVMRFDPDTAEMTYEVMVPGCSTPTCPAICEKDMDTLYITAHGSFHDAEKMLPGGPEENAGRLFKFKLPAEYRGIKEPEFVL